MHDYSNTGGKGKHKKLGKDKVGRKNKNSTTDSDKVGVNVLDKDKENIKKCLKKYYNQQREVTLMQTYKIMLNEYYSDIVKKDGILIKKVLEKHLIPTYDQFYTGTIFLRMKKKKQENEKEIRTMKIIKSL